MLNMLEHSLIKYLAPTASSASCGTLQDIKLLKKWHPYSRNFSIEEIRPEHMMNEYTFTYELNCKMIEIQIVKLVSSCQVKVT